MGYLAVWNVFYAKYAGYFQRHLPMIVILWTLGITVLFLRFLGGLAYSRRLKYYKVSSLPQKWQEKAKLQYEKEMHKHHMEKSEYKKERREHRYHYTENHERHMEKVYLKMGKANELREKITEQLIKDNLIEKDERFTFVISKKKLFINGEKQSRPVHKEYQKIIEKQLKESFESDHQFIITD